MQLNKQRSNHKSARAYLCRSHLLTAHSSSSSSSKACSSLSCCILSAYLGTRTHTDHPAAGCQVLGCRHDKVADGWP